MISAAVAAHAVYMIGVCHCIILIMQNYDTIVGWLLQNYEKEL